MTLITGDNRRFFNISELAGIRMELPEVFEHTHRLVLRLAKEGSLQLQPEGVFRKSSRRFWRIVLRGGGENPERP